MLGTPQWRALRGQRRLDVLMTMEAHAPCSMAELAEAMGCRPASLYRHVRALVEAGFLREAGRKPAGKRWTTVYARGRHLRSEHYHAPSGHGLREHGELVLSLARPAGRAYLRGVLAQRGQPQSVARRRCLAMFERTWLDARAQAEMQGLLKRVFALVQLGRRRRRGIRFQICTMVAPASR